MLAVDMSNYTDRLTPAKVQALKDAGVGLAIIQAVNPPPGYPAGRTAEQVAACEDGGLVVDAYLWLWFDLGPSDIEAKLHLLDGLSIRQLWLDVEDTAAVQYSQEECESKVQVALASCDAWYGAPQSTGVYSGRWYWYDRRYMGNTTTFSDRELWDANYDDVADAALGFVPYGGWTAPRIKQYRGSVTFAGVGGLDLNVLSVEEESELTPVEPTEPVCDWGWQSKKTMVVEAAGQLRVVAGQMRAIASRPSPDLPMLVDLADGVQKRADDILA